MNKRKLALAAGIGCFIGVLLASTLAYAKFSVHGKFAPGTSIAGVNVSYLKRQEAKAVLTNRVDTYLKSPLEVSFQGKGKGITPEKLGVNFLVDQTVDTIKTTNAKEAGLTDILGFTDREERAFGVLSVIDHEKLKNTLEEEYRFSQMEPGSATFYFDENSQIAIEEGKDGLTIDYEKLTEDLKASGKMLKTPVIEIKANQKAPPVTAEMLQKQEEDIKSALDHEFLLIDPVYSDDWNLRLADHLDWVIFTEKQKITLPYLGDTVLDTPTEALGGERYAAIEIDQDKLDEYVDSEISKWLDRPAEPVKIYKNEDGKVVVEGRGSDGLKIQRKMLKASIEVAVENRIRDVPIPVSEIKPEMDISKELQELGVKERIAVGHSSYYGSPPNRVHNIKMSASKFNGNLIAPDEVFSFNTNLGPVDGGTGYKKELVIKREGTIPEYGGGICQVSTTMFRAAMLSGLPIEERNEHSYAVSYYSQVMGDGMDATIYLGGADFKFRNDTGHHVLIQTYIENDYELYIVFYGTPDGRKVEMEGPYLSNYHYPGPTVYMDTDKLPEGQTKQVEKPHTGFNALWYRHLTDKEGNTVSEPVETRYRAIPAKIWVGIKKVET